MSNRPTQNSIYSQGGRSRSGGRIGSRDWERSNRERPGGSNEQLPEQSRGHRHQLGVSGSRSGASRERIRTHSTDRSPMSPGPANESGKSVGSSYSGRSSTSRRPYDVRYRGGKHDRDSQSYGGGFSRLSSRHAVGDNDEGSQHFGTSHSQRYPPGGPVRSRTVSSYSAHARIPSSIGTSQSAYIPSHLRRATEQSESLEEGELELEDKAPSRLSRHGISGYRDSGSPHPFRRHYSTSGDIPKDILGSGRTPPSGFRPEPRQSSTFNTSSSSSQHNYSHHRHKSPNSKQNSLHSRYTTPSPRHGHPYYSESPKALSPERPTNYKAFGSSSHSHTPSTSTSSASGVKGPVEASRKTQKSRTPSTVDPKDKSSVAKDTNKKTDGDDIDVKVKHEKSLKSSSVEGHDVLPPKPEGANTVNRQKHIQNRLSDIDREIAACQEKLVQISGRQLPSTSENVGGDGALLDAPKIIAESAKAQDLSDDRAVPSSPESKKDPAVTNDSKGRKVEDLPFTSATSASTVNDNPDGSAAADVGPNTSVPVVPRDLSPDDISPTYDDASTARIAPGATASSRTEHSNDNADDSYDEGRNQDYFISHSDSSDSLDDSTVKGSMQWLINRVYAENQTKSAETHAKLAAPFLTAFPTFVPGSYPNPSDWPFWEKNVKIHEKIRPHLTRLLSKERTRERNHKRRLQEQYSELYAKWRKRVEKLDRQRESKLRASMGDQGSQSNTGSYGTVSSGTFTTTHYHRRRHGAVSLNPSVDEFGFTLGPLFSASATMPLVTEGGGRGDDSIFTSDAVHSEAELQAIIERLQYDDARNPDVRSQRTAAVIPNMITDAREREMLRFNNNSHHIKDPLTYYHVKMPKPGTSDYRRVAYSNNADPDHYWTQNEASAFVAAYLAHPKQFGKIATYIPHKSMNDCVLFYYRNKKPLRLKALEAKSSKRARRSRQSTGNGGSGGRKRKEKAREKRERRAREERERLAMEAAQIGAPSEFDDAQYPTPLDDGAVATNARTSAVVSDEEGAQRWADTGSLDDAADVLAQRNRSNALLCSIIAANRRRKNLESAKDSVVHNDRVADTAAQSVADVSEGATPSNEYTSAVGENDEADTFTEAESIPVSRVESKMSSSYNNESQNSKHSDAGLEISLHTKQKHSVDISPSSSVQLSQPTKVYAVSSCVIPERRKTDLIISSHIAKDIHNRKVKRHPSTPAPSAIPCKSSHKYNDHLHNNEEMEEGEERIALQAHHADNDSKDVPMPQICHQVNDEPSTKGIRDAERKNKNTSEESSNNVNIGKEENNDDEEEGELIEDEHWIPRRKSRRYSELNAYAMGGSIVRTRRGREADEALNVSITACNSDTGDETDMGLRSSFASRTTTQNLQFSDLNPDEVMEEEIVEASGVIAEHSTITESPVHKDRQTTGVFSTPRSPHLVLRKSSSRFCAVFTTIVDPGDDNIGMLPGPGHLSDISNDSAGGIYRKPSRQSDSSKMSPVSNQRQGTDSKDLNSPPEEDALDRYVISSPTSHQRPLSSYETLTIGSTNLYSPQSRAKLNKSPVVEYGKGKRHSLGIHTSPIASGQTQFEVQIEEEAGDEEETLVGAAVWLRKDRVCVLRAFHKFGADFSQVASLIPTKSSAQCRYFYYHYRVPSGQMISELIPTTPSTAHNSNAGAVDFRTAHKPTDSSAQTGTTPELGLVLPHGHRNKGAKHDKCDEKSVEPEKSQTPSPPKTVASGLALPSTAVSDSKGDAGGVKRQRTRSPELHTASSSDDDDDETPLAAQLAEALAAQAAAESPGPSQSLTVKPIGNLGLNTLQQTSGTDITQANPEQINPQTQSVASLVLPSKPMLKGAVTQPATTQISQGGPRSASIALDAVSSSGPSSLRTPSPASLGSTGAPMTAKRSGYSSYWSVHERSAFMHYIVRIGANWQALSESIGSKTGTQVRNYFRANKDKLDLESVVIDYERNKAAGTLPPLTPFPPPTTASVASSSGTHAGAGISVTVGSPAVSDGQKKERRGRKRKTESRTSPVSAPPQQQVATSASITHAFGPLLNKDTTIAPASAPVTMGSQIQSPLPPMTARIPAMRVDGGRAVVYTKPTLAMSSTGAQSHVPGVPNTETSGATHIAPPLNMQRYHAPTSAPILQQGWVPASSGGPSQIGARAMMGPSGGPRLMNTTTLPPLSSQHYPVSVYPGERRGGTPSSQPTPPPVEGLARFSASPAIGQQTWTQRQQAGSPNVRRGVVRISDLTTNDDDRGAQGSSVTKINALLNSDTGSQASEDEWFSNTPEQAEDEATGMAALALASMMEAGRSDEPAQTHSSYTDSTRAPHATYRTSSSSAFMTTGRAQSIVTSSPPLHSVRPSSVGPGGTQYTQLPRIAYPHLHLPSVAYGPPQQGFSQTYQLPPPEGVPFAGVGHDRYRRSTMPTGTPPQMFGPGQSNDAYRGPPGPPEPARYFTGPHNPSQPQQ